MDIRWTFDYTRLIICSPSLYQPDYQVVIKALNAGLNGHQILKLFEIQNNILDIDKAIKTIADHQNTTKSKIKSNQYYIRNI